MLASGSPRRAALLRTAGYRFIVQRPRADEAPRDSEPPAAMAERLAREKACEVARRLNNRRAGAPGDAPRILAADTVVIRRGIVLGKPVDDRDARRMLRLLSGGTHRVVSGVAVCGPGGVALRSLRVTTLVTFRRLSAEEIRWYVSTGEPSGKAGAYAVQGRASIFITRISGSWTNVVGLPMESITPLIGLPPR